ncbi:hypothetical protein NY035_09575 [Corynebacterium diphtheriae bv. mitis]|uniref:Uncharacterized protein n=1 Tax=Corynebacterium diphtheriae TaxID=1717 RepID=A0A1J5X3T8_CORDP|nr:hypothetical protein [Corynebacterium diphtheriae]OWN41732.1 hypothetical protein AY488_04120 [Corynebacterium belfantii]AEX44568.1 hypothetical protein CD241_1511 [Corynebacterium diphtheriae 241]AEX46777.1 hypothetical protein CDB402_1478 [Corynebacterium diphtheriae INCA 402]AEX49078.1 hypothetical protein CDBH8_1560 [Corynebacterium diphtheriae BH8]AEX70214.1 hypothetical protein CDPW8_1562 [Corynebacterium diphtheriae PW8]
MQSETTSKHTDILTSLQLSLTPRRDPTFEETTTDEQTSVQIALSPCLNATIASSKYSLDDLDVSAQYLWDTAADNLIYTTSNARGIPIRTRPTTFLTKRMTEGLQVDVTGAPTSAWIAHPLTFEVIYHHLANILCATPVFYVPHPQLLIAVASHIVSPQLESWLSTFSTPLVKDALIYHEGFPAHIKSSAWQQPLHHMSSDQLSA